MGSGHPLLRRALGLTALTVALGLAGGCADGTTQAQRGSTTAEATLAGFPIDVRKDPGCGCCTSWVEYLQEHGGATIEVAEDADRDSFRAEHGIPDEAASCHTAVIEGYAIEGHVPVGAIQRLLSERPDAAGLALPGMPADGPGMGGNESDWESQPVMLIGNDGSLSTFEY